MAATVTERVIPHRKEQNSQSHNTTHSTTSQESVEGMGRWVWHKLFCMLLGYTSGKSTSLAKEIWLSSQNTFPCERVGYGQGAMLTYSATVERETIWYVGKQLQSKVESEARMPFILLIQRFAESLKRVTLQITHGMPISGRDGYTVEDSSVTHFSCEFIFCEEVWHLHLEYYQTWS